jgi:hypothetical protein
MTTFGLILGAIALLAILLAFAMVGLLLWAVLGDAPETVQPLIRSHENPDIIGDGAWNAPGESALISRMPEPRGM